MLRRRDPEQMSEWSGCVWRARNETWRPASMAAAKGVYKYKWCNTLRVEFQSTLFARLALRVG